ncbi:MAG: PAS domain S-box protein [Thaumarchaeota archaeon]|nr:PAS domain S-box protein [Nitrososphaerota archaeon]
MEPHTQYSTEKTKEYENFIEKNLDALMERYSRVEQKYRSLYDDSPDLLRTINLSGIIIDCNQTYAKKLGYARGEIIGASIFEHVTENSLDALKESFRIWKTNGNVRDREIWLKRKDNTIFPTLLSATNLYDTDGKLIGSNTTIKDISEIHHAQKRLVEHEKILQEQHEQIRTSSEILLETELRYRSLYEHSPDLLRTIDTNGQILDCNKTYAEKLGYSKEEILGKSIFFHTADRSVNEMQDALKKWKDTGIIKNSEIWLKRKDNTIFPTLLSATNLYDKNGDLVERIAALRDMTEIYTAREEIEQQKVKRISDMGVLSARIAHDLKNPLSVIKNSIELMKMRTINQDDKTRVDLERIERATVRISHQIEEVLEYVWPKPLDLRDSSLLDILNVVVSKINVQQVAIDLPKTDTNAICDASKLEIVFSNLIMNAVQAMNGIGNIDIRIKNEEKTTTIEIEDTGPGIPQDLLPKIFEPLFTTKQIGTGLGLVSCKSIIEKHGGTITAQTQINKGTTFIIELPKIYDN